MAGQRGFDWLNMAGIKSDSDLPPPPVSFGASPIPSNTSLMDLNANHNSNKPQQPTELVEEYDDLVAPLSLDASQLTTDEAKTYLRWYNDMVVRKGTKLIKLSDVFQFLSNFKLSEYTIRLLERIFKDIVSLNIGEFFALLRVISHTLLGETPRRRLTNIPAPILKPKSILARKRVQEEEQEPEIAEQGNGNAGGESSKIDLDSFTKFILTGERPGSSASNSSGRKKKKSKRVKFSDEVSVEPGELKPVDSVSLDLSLPMDQLLKNLSSKQKHQAPPPQIQINEEEELNEMKDSLNHFQNIKNVDSALIHGAPSNIPSIFFDEANKSGKTSPDPSSLSPNPTGQQIHGLLAPNHTGPVPSLFNALQPNTTESPPGYLSPNRPSSPNYTGTGSGEQPLVPTMTGSLSGGLRQQYHMSAPTPEQQQQIQASLHLGDSANGRASLNLGYPNQSPSPSFNNPALNTQSFEAQGNRFRSTSSPQPYNLSIPTPLQARSSINNNLLATPNIAGTSRTPSPLPPPPPPSRRARTSSNPNPPPVPPARNYGTPPTLPPKTPLQAQHTQSYSSFPPPPQVSQNYQQQTATGTVQIPSHPGNYVSPTEFYQAMTNGSGNGSSSTADILGDLQALQNDIEKLQFNNGSYR